MISFKHFINEKKMCETHYSAEALKDLKVKHADDKELMKLISAYEEKDDDESYEKIKSYLSSKDQFLSVYK